MRNKKYFIFVARLAPENASIFVETRGGIRFPRVRARARTTARRHREITRGRNDNNRIRYAAGRGRPALPTASSAIKPNVHVVISSVSREIPCGRNGTIHTRASPLACGGSPPRNPPQQKQTQSYSLCGGTRASRPTDGIVRPKTKRTRCHFGRQSRNSRGRNGTKHTRAGPPRQWRLATEKSPAVGTERYIHAPANLPVAARHREIPRDRNGTIHTRAGPLVCGGSPPRNPLR